MLLKDFYKKNLEEGGIFSIPVSDIVLKEKCHIKAMNDGHTITGGKQNPCVIVTEDTSGKYNLLIGWADYMLAVQNGEKEIPAIIMDKNKYENNITRKDFIKWVSLKPEFDDLKNIKVDKSFVQSPPHKYKIDNVRQQAIDDTTIYFIKHPIIVSEDNIVLDGYTRYLVACELKPACLSIARMNTKIFQKYFYRDKRHKTPIIPTSQT